MMSSITSLAEALTASLAHSENLASILRSNVEGLLKDIEPETEVIIFKDYPTGYDVPYNGRTYEDGGTFLKGVQMDGEGNVMVLFQNVDRNFVELRLDELRIETLPSLIAAMQTVSTFKLLSGI